MFMVVIPSRAEMATTGGGWRVCVVYVFGREEDERREEEDDDEGERGERGEGDG